MSNQDGLIGRTLGTCTLEKLLGRGGMGAVYLARQVRPSRHVAVKVLQPNVSVDSSAYNDFLVRFRREADVIARLEHVNIMPIYEYGEEGGLAYLVMPYMPGGSLRDVLNQKGALSLAETATYLDQAASALTYAHKHGVIHRDIKPSNFLIHSDGRLVLADFGIARMMQEDRSSGVSTLTGSGMLVGTPDYMAPEMASGEIIDQRADIYELGILLFQMLSGRVPFTGSNPLMVAVKQIQEPLPSLHQLNPAIPPAVDAVVQKATAKKREDRYLWASDLAQAFRAAIIAPAYPDYPTGNSPWNTSIMPRSQPIAVPPVVPQQNVPLVLPAAQQSSNTPPGQYPMPRTPTPVPSTPAWSSSSSSGANAAVDYYSVTPSGSQQTASRGTARPWLILLSSLLALVLIVGGILLGAKVYAALTASGNTGVSSTHQTGGPGSTPTTQHTPTSTPTPTPSQKAAATVRQYFSDINSRDYTDAYNLRGQQLQSQQTYDNFVSGYAQTEHDDVTLGAVTPNSDGTFHVPVTIVATEDNTSGSGTHQSTYQGYYTVGQENGSLKLLGGQINKVG